jgi:putative aminopeptidase FrvX
VLEALRMLAQDRPGGHGRRRRDGAGGDRLLRRRRAHQRVRLDPQLAIVVDVTFASDAPGIEKKEVGEHKLGSGPVLTRGSAAHPVMVERLVDVAEKEQIPYTLIAAPRFTATDADGIYLSRAGVATAVISVPNRYMHSPNEIVSLADLMAAAHLIAAFCQSAAESDNWVP